MTFTAESVPDQQGKVFVITGGNSGIGLEAARVLVKKRAQVVLACRDATKMKAAADLLLRETSGAVIDQVVLDLGSLASVRAAAKVLAERHPRIDVLVNNAGVMAIPYRETKDGIEMQMGTNHFGHFALTGLVLPNIAAAPAGRVVNVSSMLHTRGTMVFSDIPKPAKYSEGKAYSMSKLANVLFAYELDRKLKAAKIGVRSVACHPGYSATNLQMVGPEMAGSAVKRAIMVAANTLLAQPAAMGALGTLYAATGDDIQGGEYIGPTAFFGARGYPVKAPSSASSHDAQVAQRLWEVSEKLTGVTYALTGATVRNAARA